MADALYIYKHEHSCLLQRVLNWDHLPTFSNIFYFCSYSWFPLFVCWVIVVFIDRWIKVYSDVDELLKLVVRVLCCLVSIYLTWINFRADLISRITCFRKFEFSIHANLIRDWPIFSDLVRIIFRGLKAQNNTKSFEACFFLSHSLLDHFFCVVLLPFIIQSKKYMKNRWHYCYLLFAIHFHLSDIFLILRAD